jgi:hypothetical protein
MTNVCDFIKEDINCLMLLTQTNKQIRDIIINNTSYVSQIESIRNTINYEKMFRYIRIYSESKVFNNNNNIIEYLSKINNMIPYMISSHLYALNVEICLNYSSVCVNYWNKDTNNFKYLYRCMIEEAKILYYIIKQIDPQYQIVITSDNYMVKFDTYDLINWLDSINNI